MSARPFMPIYWADYFGDTQHLSTVQHGAYLLLIAHYWSHGSLPDDDEVLARICKMRVDTWRRWHRETIIHFFNHGTGSSLVHKRIDAELARAHAFSEKQRNNALQRWHGTDASAYAKRMPARAFHNQHIESSLLTNEGVRHRPNGGQPPHATASRSAAKRPPRKQDRAAAARATWEADLAKMLTPDDHATVIEALAENHALTMLATQSEIAHPHTGAKVVLEQLAHGGD